MGVNKRVRPITYAEALEAKESLKNNEIINDKIKNADSEYKQQKKQIEMVKNIDNIEEESENFIIGEDATSLTHIKIKDLPSGGKPYKENSSIYYKPLTFGDVKFLSGSKLSDIESIDFFLDHIICSFNKNLLTYYDFYFLSVLIKASTFGDGSYSISFDCSRCGNIIKKDFEIEDLDFNDLQIPLPARIKRDKKFISNTDSGSISDEFVEFSPLTILNYRFLLKNGLNENYNAFMAVQITNFDFEDALRIVDNELVGVDVNLLESIEEMFYHGVNDLKIVCKNKIGEPSPKVENIEEHPEDDAREVCGHIHNIPFQSLSKYISSTDSIKTSIRDRLSFGL